MLAHKGGLRYKGVTPQDLPHMRIQTTCHPFANRRLKIFADMPADMHLEGDNLIPSSILDAALTASPPFLLADIMVCWYAWNSALGVGYLVVVAVTPCAPRPAGQASSQALASSRYPHGFESSA